MSLDDETLMAFADGALAAERAAEAAAAVAADPVLAAKVERFRAVRAKVGLLKDSAPGARDRLMDDARQAVAQRAAASRTWIPVLAAGVTGLAIGLGVAVLGRGDGLADFRNDGAATGLLEAALDGTASGQVARKGGESVSPIYTVVAADGRPCRAFRALAGQAAYEGAACRDGGTWRLVVLAATPRPTSGFAQASGDEPAAVTAAIDGLDPSDPLGMAAEQALIARRWTPAEE